jgi:hypothetical protein
MALVLVVAVVSVSGVVDGAAYLAGAGRTVAFDPVSYQTDCQIHAGCQTSTAGILQTGGAGVSATWPDVVPLGKSFQVREPVWRWGIGIGSLIDSDKTAVIAILVSLLLDGAAVLVVWFLVRLVRSWHRHRRRLRPAQT